MAEQTAVTGSKILASEGIGSCVVVCLIDEENDVAGMAHVVLPSKRKSNGSSKYADNLLEDLLQEMEDKGAELDDLKSKIFGGGSLFDFSNEIGQQNISSVKEFLEERDIPVVSEDTGGSKGRSVEFYANSGKVEVTKYSESKKVH